jgi:hypothetical protein
MTPLNLDLLYLIESGPKVTLVGKDPTTGDHMAIQVDLRPCAAFWASLEAAADDTTYAADGVRLSLALTVDDAGSQPGAA